MLAFNNMIQFCFNSVLNIDLKKKRSKFNTFYVNI